ncbi:MAG: PilZ domain-containing protein [Gammaproteobacteria bacterium]|nr:PilZ domain-containing protein [Gammaproteobacteria bacterium]MDD9823850.1 PilZ domain-containing protein [Gammaproteobacteria bacterium]MDD9863293.1 PilZ domain-containing protein [Gammaproteobacteria bacterium]
MDNRISLTIRDKNALYASYMPFVKNGGLFIPTNKQYELRQEIFILLTLQLPELRETLPIAGQVVWISPAGQSGRRPGIGVQFSDLDRGATKNKIEGQLAGALESDRPTQTM